MEQVEKLEERIDWAPVIVLIIGTFMAILDGTIVNVALPKMIAVFNTNAEKGQWIATAYMLTLGIIMPISGYLGDRYGYKRIYILALVLFVAGSALCGMAWNLEAMIAARIIQALGGGLMQPVGMAILYGTYPRSRIGMVLGVWGIAAMAAPAVGPTLGGYLVDYISWRLIFYINVPLGILNVFLALMILKETRLIKGKSFDFKGLISSTVGFFCLLLALSEAGSKGWNSPYIVTLLFIAFTSLLILVLSELEHPDPILDFSLFKNYIFTISVVIGSIISIGMFGVIFLFPLFMQSVLGQTAMQTGLIMFPAALASGIVMPVSGRLFDRYGARGIVAGGLLVVTFTTFMMARFNALTPFAVMTLWLTLRGFGMGFCFMPVTTAGMNTVPPHLVGRASALNNVIRQVSSAFGIAMFTTVMQKRQVFHYANITQGINLSPADISGVQQGMSGLLTHFGFAPDVMQGISMSLLGRQIFQESMVRAINDCFIISSLLCLLAFFLAFTLKDRNKKEKIARDVQAGEIAG